MEQRELVAFGHLFFEVRGGREVGRARLYLIENDLHDRPYGLLEDVWVDERYRSEGIGGRLVQAVIAKAKEQCYKLVATSRNDGTRDEVHDWYKRLGFTEWGTEFRMDF